MSRAYIGTNNFFDIKTRLDISKVIEEFISKNKKEEVNIINVGSPYLWEVADLSINKTENKYYSYRFRLRTRRF